MKGIHALFARRDQIQRTVTQVPGGVKATTESDDPAVVVQLREHVQSMYKRLKEGRPINGRDPLFAATFENADKQRFEIALNRFGLAGLSPRSEVLTMRVVIESIGKVGSRATVGGHELVFDQPATVPGGEDRGASPLDVMSVSVAACAHYFAAAYLHARGLSPDGLTVEVTADKERVPVSRIGRLALKVQLPAGVSDRHLAGVERAIKSCPAYGTLLHPPSVELSIGLHDDAEVPGEETNRVVG